MVCEAVRCKRIAPFRLSGIRLAEAVWGMQ